MAIKLSKNNLFVNQIIGQKTEKIIVEGDEIVPDIKPDILSIVSTNGNVCIYKKEVTDGKIKIDGSVNAYVIYIADDENSSIRAINTSIDFSKTIEMKEIKSTMIVECNNQLSSIDCRILNGRKVNIRSGIEMSVTAYSKENIAYIDKIENTKNIQLLNRSMDINRLIGSGSTKVYAKDTISIDNVDNLSEVMKVNISIENRECKISYNKILAKSDAAIKLMYLTDDNRINTASATIPVIGFIDMQDINDDDICDLSYELKNIIVKPNNVEEHSVYIEAELEILAFVYKKEQINIIQDMYSRNSNLSYTQDNVRIMSEKQSILETFNFRKQERIEDIAQNKIYDVEITPVIVNIQTEEGKAVLSGDVNLVFIYSQNDSRGIGVKSLIEPFEFTVTSPSITEKSKIQTTVGIIKKDFVIMPDNNIDIKIDFEFRLNIVKEESINIINEVIEQELDGKDTFSIVIYYTKAGDTLWKIAKRFGSTVADIANVNNIEDSNKIMVGQQLFIPR